MKKIMLLLCAFLLVLGVGVTKVTAKEVATSSSVYTLKTVTDARCEGVLGDPNDSDSVAYFLQGLFNVFKFAAPILVLIMTVIEFVKAITSQDKDMITKAGKKTALRLVLAVVLFFVPTILNLALSWLGAYSTCGIG